LYTSALSKGDGYAFEIDNCIFRDNVCEQLGGAIFHTAGAFTMTNTLLIGNRAETGGGMVSMAQDDMIIEDCVFVDNQADTGGGLCFRYSYVGLVKDCTFVGNKATTGSGIAIVGGYSGNLEIQNTLITDGITGEGLAWDGIGSLQLTCTDLYGNEGGDWVGSIEDRLGLDGNISADPCYCGAQNPDDPWTLDMTSPCLDVAGCGRIGARGSGCDLTGVTAPPKLARLWPCAPNPFNPRTTISFELTGDARVSLEVFDAAGRLVCGLISGEIRSEGHHAVTWDGTDDGGRRLASGVYLCRLQAGSIIDFVRLALVK